LSLNKQEFYLHFNGAQFEIGQDKLTFVSEGNEFAVISVNGKVLVENTLGELLPEFFEKISLIKTLKPQTLLIEQPIFRFALENYEEVGLVCCHD
jgi:hypothetical protein